MGRLNDKSDLSRFENLTGLPYLSAINACYNITSPAPVHAAFDFSISVEYF
jgi:hypothetical protein